MAVRHRAQSFLPCDVTGARALLLGKRPVCGSELKAAIRPHQLFATSALRLRDDSPGKRQLGAKERNLAPLRLADI